MLKQVNEREDVVQMARWAQTNGMHVVLGWEHFDASLLKDIVKDRLENYEVASQKEAHALLEDPANFLFVDKYIEKYDFDS